MRLQHSIPLLAALLVATPTFAQDAATLIARGDSAHAAFDPETALTAYEAALALDSTNADVLAKASMSAVDLGESLADKARQKELFRRAERYARGAVAADSTSAENWFHLARAVGRTALTMGVRDRVKYAVEIKRWAERSLAIDSSHAGALHVLGMWNAEVKRLSGVELFFARSFLGGGVLGQANWKNAVSYMERAVASDPGRLTHRLDLAGVYADVGEKEKARATYESVINEQTRTDFNDPLYKKQAEAALKKLR
jgi:tetratricopeptide (TPR) repeat protein